jgi:hypothetical protein
MRATAGRDGASAVSHRAIDRGYLSNRLPVGKRGNGLLKVTLSEVVTDAAPVYPAVLDQLIPSAWRHLKQHANHPIEADPSNSNTGYDLCAGCGPTQQRG